MKQRLVSWIIALVGVAAFSGGLVFLSRRPIGGGAGRKASHVAVGPDGPARKAAVQERFVGVVVSRAALDVTPRIEGRLKQLFVTVGQEVRANDRIALLDDDAVRRDLALAQATLQATRAGANRADIELGDAREKSARRGKVASELSAEEVAASQTAEKLGGASVSAAQAAVAEQKARIAKLVQERAYTEVRAPFPGKIAAAYVAPGAQLTTQTPIVRLVQNEDLCVRFAVPSSLTAQLGIGRRIRFDLETVHVSLPGTIENVAPEVDPGSQMIYVEANLDLDAASRAKIQPGLVARVRLVDPQAPGDGDDWQELETPPPAGERAR